MALAEVNPTLRSEAYQFPGSPPLQKTHQNKPKRGFPCMEQSADAAHEPACAKMI